MKLHPIANLFTLPDTNLSSLANNNVLQYDGTKWVNRVSLKLADGANIGIASDTTLMTLTDGLLTLGASGAGNDVGLAILFGDLNVGTGGTVLDVDSTLGTVGIGTAAMDTALLLISDILSPDDSFDGIRGGIILTPTVAGKTYIANKQQIAVTTNVDTALMVGFEGGVVISRNQNNTVLIDEVIGFHAEMGLNIGGPSGANDLTATDFSLFKGEPVGALGNNGFIDNLYGLWLPDITEGTNNWAIKTGLGLVETGGGRIVKADRLASNTTLDATHHHVFCDTDGGVFTVTLPASPVDGQTYRIANTGSSSNLLTIARNGNLLVGGTADKTASDGTVIILTFETTEGWF